jgi:hypothetical protein
MGPPKSIGCRGSADPASPYPRGQTKSLPAARLIPSYPDPPSGSPDLRRRSLKISRGSLELAQDLTRRLAAAVRGHLQAVINVIVDQSPLCLRNRLLNGIKLLGEVKAGSAFTEHRYDSPDVPFGPFKPFYDIWMAFMDVRFYHFFDPAGWGYAKRIRQR